MAWSPDKTWWHQQKGLVWLWVLVGWLPRRWYLYSKKDPKMPEIECLCIFLWKMSKKLMFPKIGVLQNGWFLVGNLIEMDDLGLPPIFGNTQVDVSGVFIKTYQKTRRKSPFKVDQLGEMDFDAAWRQDVKREKSMLKSRNLPFCLVFLFVLILLFFLGGVFFSIKRLSFTDSLYIRNTWANPCSIIQIRKCTQRCLSVAR